MSGRLSPAASHAAQESIRASLSMPDVEILPIVIGLHADDVGVGTSSTSKLHDTLLDQSISG